MPTWLLIAALATIGVTALLIGVLYRLNKPMLERKDRGGDGGGAGYAGDGGHRARDDVDSGDSDGGGDSGGDGGGGD